MEGPRQPPLAEADRRQADCHERQTAECEGHIDGNGRVIVERDAAIHLQPGDIQPAKTCGLQKHQDAINSRIQPARRPVPEEESARENERHRKDEDQDRAARPNADGKGCARQQNDWRHGKDERRSQVVGDRVRAADLVRLVVGIDVVEEHHRQELQSEHDQECREHAQEFAPDVFAWPQGRGV